MLKLEDLKRDAQIRGLELNEVVRIVAVESFGEDARTVVYRRQDGTIADQTVFRNDELRLDLAQEGRPWGFDAPGEDFKLGLEAYRIRLAHLFDPMMAVHTSNVEPLPHQITAVYESMLPRQPLRYVLADDPGAGKTIMAGLLIRELIIRADARRILIVTPGSLVEQWQDELVEKFGLRFEIFSRAMDDASPSRNPFEDNDQLIIRLDQLSRNEDYQEKLSNTSWDLIVVDEAHKLSASYFGSKVNKTKRFELGELLGTLTRHFLLMTATPHNGKEADFQLFMSLLDGDRFYGKFRDGVHKVDTSDMMRRMVKEDLLKFDGSPLFPERRAYTANYSLSPLEESLYANVTEYVTEEMNRAEALEGKRKGTVGFALTILQRRLASSPEAIYQSLKRRRKKLEGILEEKKLVARGHKASETYDQYNVYSEIPDNLDEAEDELSPDVYENWADKIVDQATTSETIEEYMAEIESLKRLEQQAAEVVHSGQDRKWEELSGLLQERPEMYNAAGNRRKLIIFTEHKDTLNYLLDRIRGLLGNPEAVDAIHGGVARDQRRVVQEQFRNNKDFLVLIATDAAGEGVNLQHANLMVNYDLPWNPNRLEQRFGRIHRIGQTEVCHLWNLVANQTREGMVFQRLFEKLEIEREALGGRVFDILGEAFENKSLKDLLIDAIRYGELPEVRDRLNKAIEGALDNNHLKAIMARNMLCEDHMSLEQLYLVKEEMEKAEARKLQPYFIRAFFNEAFKALSGELRARESGRFEIAHVPAAIRERDRVISETRTPVTSKYIRICFEKQDISVPGKEMASLIHPGHPLMHAVLDLTLEAHRPKLKQGAILVDPTDDSTEPKVLFMIDHRVRESQGNPPRDASRRLQFVTINEKGEASNAGWAPHLDLQPIQAHEKALVQDVIDAPWLSANLEALALHYASQKLVPEHFEEIRERREHQVDRVLQAVRQRLVKEISHWSDRYIKLSEDVAAGKQPLVQPENARRRADELTARLEQRTKELEAERNVRSSTPTVIGGALIIPQGLLAQRSGDTTFTLDSAARARVERIAMEAVTKAEQAMGHEVFDVSAQKCGWDLTARPPKENGKLVEERHIEVKGRAKGQTTITISKNEIHYALNQRDKFILAIVLVDGETFEGPYYLRNPFTREPDFGVASSNYDLDALLSKAGKPEPNP
jgi:SNF2 family DNA or RNA helicase